MSSYHKIQKYCKLLQKISDYQSNNVIKINKIKDIDYKIVNKIAKQLLSTMNDFNYNYIQNGGVLNQETINRINQISQLLDRIDKLKVIRMLIDCLQKQEGENKTMSKLNIPDIPMAPPHVDLSGHQNISYHGMPIGAFYKQLLDLHHKIVTEHRLAEQKKLCRNFTEITQRWLCLNAYNDNVTKYINMLDQFIIFLNEHHIAHSIVGHLPKAGDPRYYINTHEHLSVGL